MHPLLSFHLPRTHCRVMLRVSPLPRTQAAGRVAQRCDTAVAVARTASSAGVAAGWSRGRAVNGRWQHSSCRCTRRALHVCAASAATHAVLVWRLGSGVGARAVGLCCILPAQLEVRILPGPAMWRHRCVTSLCAHAHAHARTHAHTRAHAHAHAHSDAHARSHAFARAHSRCCLGFSPRGVAF
jgi:hypothetical protein